MPPDVSFDASRASPAFISADQELKIEKGSLIIVKVVGIRLAANDIVRVGSFSLHC